MNYFFIILILILSLKINSYSFGNVSSYTGLVNNNLSKYLDAQKPISSQDNSSLNIDEWYVSPSGLDEYNLSNDGSIDHPFKTLNYTLTLISQLNKIETKDQIIYLRGGIYEIEDTIKITPKIGGNNQHKIIIKNYDNEQPIIDGGRRITGWKKTNITHKGHDLWVASMPDNITDSRQLYWDEIRLTRAKGSADFIIDTNGDGHEVKANTIENWNIEIGYIQDIEFVYENIWTLPRIHVEKVDTRKNPVLVYMQQPAFGYSRQIHARGLGNPLWVENVFELLDEPGEWFLDRKTNQIYLIPPSNSDSPNAHEIVVPKIDTLLSIKGNDSEQVKNITFEGILFRYSTWLTPNKYGVGFVDHQANVFAISSENGRKSAQSPGSIFIEYAKGIQFKECNFTHFGTGAIDFRDGVQYSSLIGCRIWDISGIEIQIGSVYHPDYTIDNPGVTRNIIIKNNYLVNGSLEYMGGPAIFAGYVRNIVISHNTISNMPYTGISVGWGWSSKETICANNSIIFNHIYGIMNYLTDGGGIYTLSTQPGTNVSYNVIHDSGWNGLYPDERTNGTTWSYNIVYDCYNSFLDHSMYDESYWNDVYDNYLDTYPKYLWVWYPDRDNDQIWGLKPGDEGFPTGIYYQAGVEENYKYLIPKNEIYYHYEPNSSTILQEHPEIMVGYVWLIMGIATIIGLYTMKKEKIIGINIDKELK